MLKRIKKVYLELKDIPNVKKGQTGACYGAASKEFSFTITLLTKKKFNIELCWEQIDHQLSIAGPISTWNATLKQLAEVISVYADIDKIGRLPLTPQAKDKLARDTHGLFLFDDVTPKLRKRLFNDMEHYTSYAFALSRGETHVSVG